MSTTHFVLKQDIFRHSQPPIHVDSVQEHEAEEAVITFARSLSDGSVGIAAAYDKCRLTALAFASGTCVLIVRFAKGKQGKKGQKPKHSPPRPGRDALRLALLSHPTLRKLGYNLDRLVTSLYIDVDLRMTHGVDLLGLAGQRKKGHGSLDVIAQTLGDWGVLGDRERIIAVFQSERFDANKLDVLALRAWASYRAGTAASAAVKLENEALYDTHLLPDTVSCHSRRLESL